MIVASRNFTFAHFAPTKLNKDIRRTQQSNRPNEVNNQPVKFNLFYALVMTENVDANERKATPEADRMRAKITGCNVTRDISSVEFICGKRFS